LGIFTKVFFWSLLKESAGKIIFGILPQKLIINQHSSSTAKYFLHFKRKAEEK